MRCPRKWHLKPSPKPKVKGRRMSYFQGKALKKVDVLGNAESLYYALRTSVGAPQNALPAGWY